MESITKARENEYYQVLGTADESADCSGFIVDAVVTALRQAPKAETPVEMLVIKNPTSVVLVGAVTRRNAGRSRLGTSVSAVELGERRLRQRAIAL